MASKPNNPKLQNEEETIPPRQSSSSRFGSQLVRLLSLLPAIAFLFFTVNVVTSAYHARQDPGTLAFVLSSYVNLLLLFWCLKKFESLEEDSRPPEEKEKLKVAIWVLATALNFTFAWRVAGMMPLALAVVIWATAASVAVAGFYGLFMYKGETGHGIRHDDMKSSDGRRSPEGEV